MRASLFLHLFFLLPLFSEASPQDNLPWKIDREVAGISGFIRERAAPRCDDGEFLRRVMLDLVGYPPTARETRAFVADATANKRDAVVERLLASDRFADFWARRWMAAFFGNYHDIREQPFARLDPEERDRILERFRQWLAGRIHRDWPWTETVRDLLIAEGTPDVAPALAYKLVLDGWPRAPYLEGRAVSHFMGIDLSCTGCHDHPFDHWTIDDGYSLAAFSTGRKVRWGATGIEVTEGREPPNRPIPGDKGILPYPRQPNNVYPPVFLRKGKPADGEVLARAFARLITAPENVQFRKAFVNRVWAWLLGRGIVSPVDEFDLKNRPLSAGLLNLLANAFADNDHSLRFLIRAICATEAYQRRSDGTPASGKVNFSRAQIRPLSAEQLLHSIEVATLGRPRFDLDRARRIAEKMSRAQASTCETSEVIPDVRALAWLADSDDVWSLIRDGSVLKACAAEPGDPETRVNAMFLAALSREAGPLELDRYTRFLKGRGEAGFRDAYWTLLNSTEFLTRH
jgi:uncharacterized protein DUF1549/uncharacterized protein DUF1553